MTFEYELNPQSIEHNSFRQIRELTQLDSFSLDEQQVVMRIVHSMGLPEAASQVRFSDNACASGRQALAQNASILCDVEMV